MRVGILTGSVSRKAGGVFNSVRNLSLALRDLGVDVKVFGLTDEATADDLPAWQGLSVHTSRISGPRAFGYAGNMYRAVAGAHLDVLHIACTWMYPTLVSLRWMRESGRPVVVSPRGDLDPWALANSHLKKRIAGALYENRHLQRAACLHALCKAEAGAFGTYGLNNPICIIPNGVELPKNNASHRAPPWSDQVSKEERVLLFLGRLHHKKNITALIEAWSAVCQRETAARHWWLAIAGWDQLGYEAVCKDLVNRLGAARILFVGPLYGADKEASFRNASAFVLPSLSEGMPLTVLEAWSYGLPVLMTPECNLPEGAQNGAAIEIEGSVNGIVAGLRTLMKMNKDNLLRMSSAGRRLVEGRFTWARVAGEMMTVYRWLSEDGNAPRHMPDKFLPRT